MIVWQYKKQIPTLTPGRPEGNTRWFSAENRTHPTQPFSRQGSVSSNYKSILLINHEPTVKNLVRYLTKNHETNNFKLMNYKFPTAAFAKIKFDIKGWDEIEKKGILKKFIRPKDLQDSKE